MGQEKKTPSKGGKGNKKVEAAVSAPFVGLNDKRMGKTRMRVRDQLAETNATLDAEIHAQELALEQGLVVTKMVTMTEQDAENFREVLVCMKKLWSGVNNLTTATNLKVIQDLEACITRIDMVKALELKAFSPEEKAAAAKTLADDEAKLAEILARVNAAKSILN
jgi:hypothetical protein